MCITSGVVTLQESDKYQNIVRQPMDLDAIRRKLRRGSYSTCTLAFYRDLLLLFNNALVYYPKSSLESNTARELLRIVIPEIKKKPTKHPSSSSTTLKQDTSVSILKPETDRSDSLLAKQKSSAPIIVCRKRSSISAKPSSTTFGQKTEPRSEEKKPSADARTPAKPPASSSASPQEQNLIKINTKERSITGTRSLRRSNKNIKTTPAPPAPPTKKQGSTPTSGSTDKADTHKGDQKKSEAVSSTKKRSAADFLKRIKRNSPVGKTKNSGDDHPNPKGGKGGGGSGGGEQKKRQSGKAEKGEDKGTKQGGGGGGSSSSARHGREESASSPSKKGRPPKRGVEPPPPPTKRGRDDGGKEAQKRPPRKRSRR